MRIATGYRLNGPVEAETEMCRRHEDFPGLIFAPWSGEDVAALERWQNGAPWSSVVTCGAHPWPSPRLVPMAEGWRCPVAGCVFEQDWAYAAMLHPPPAVDQTVPIRLEEQR